MELSRTLHVIHAGMQAGLHLGAQLYVWRSGEVLADLGIGLARPPGAGTDPQPMTPDTITPWFSSGKPLTAVAAAQLWEKGLLDLDDPVAKFIPEFDQHGKGPITLRHILAHMAPLRIADFSWPGDDWDYIIQKVCAARPEPRWILGKTAGYSGQATWFVLGEIVRRLSGQTLQDYLQQHVFAPCGMTSSFLAMTREQYEALQPRLGLMARTDRPASNESFYNSPESFLTPSPGASARGPIRELGKLYQALLHRGLPRESRDVSPKADRLLRPQTIEAMTARHRVHTHDKTFNAVVDWGLGLIINSNIYPGNQAPYQYGPHASPRTFGHSGNQSSTAFADAEHGLVVAIVFNGRCGEAAHQARIHQTLEAVYQDVGLAN